MSHQHDANPFVRFQLSDPAVVPGVVMSVHALEAKHPQFARDIIAVLWRMHPELMASLGETRPADPYPEHLPEPLGAPDIAGGLGSAPEEQSQDANEEDERYVF